MKRCIVAAVLVLLSALVQAGPMSTPGQFEVAATGAATYTIPISVPLGTAGIEPKLSLVYNSQSGNGLLGVGWSLSGLSATTRCPRTMAQDGVRGGINYDMSDRFCLDGQRLMAINGAYGADGTEYRTERESFSKIVSYGSAGNGPAWFKVWTKAGLIVEYGNTADSRIEAQGKGTVRVWALNKLSDTEGNYLTVSYTEDNGNGDYYPNRIDYTGNSSAGISPNNSVLFSYVPRANADIPRYFEAGSLTSSTMCIAEIQAYANGGVLAKKYQYSNGVSGATGRSLLTNVLECDGDGTCLPASAFQWSQATNGLTAWQAWNPSYIYGFDLGSCRGVLPADVNGDGWVDLVCPYNNGNAQTRTWVQINQGGSFSSWQPWNPSYNNGFELNNCRALQAVDLNGDGLADLVCSYDYGNGVSRTWVQINHGGSFSYWQPWNPSNTNGFDLNSCRGLQAVDVNGDGLADLICPYNNGNAQTRTWVQINQGGSFSNWQPWNPSYNNGFELNNCRVLQAVDLNGDGLADLVCPYDYGNGVTRTWVQINQGGSFSYWQPWNSSDISGFMLSSCHGLQAADLNGDGKADLVCAYDNGSSMTRTWVQINLGNGFTTWQPWNPTYITGFALDSCKMLQAADMNGDGRADLVCAYDNGNAMTRTWVQLNQGNSFSAWQPWNSAYSTGFALDQCSLLQVVDVTGDGKADVICAYNNGAATTRTWVQTNSPPLPDLLVDAKNGLGDLALTYKPLSDATVYAKGSNAAFPSIDLNIPLYAVSSALVSNGNSSYPTSYKYGGLKGEAGTGRGLLGFAWMEATNPATGTTVHTDYRQDWPYTGLPSVVKKTVGSGGNAGLLSQTSYTYGCLDPQLGSVCTVAAGNRYFPYVSQSVESGYDLSGTALPTVTTTNQFDAYGNATQVSVMSSDGFSKTTANTYTNDPTNWYLGRLQRSQVQSVAP